MTVKVFLLGQNQQRLLIANMPSNTRLVDLKGLVPGIHHLKASKGCVSREGEKYVD